ncbi:hypothetical protein AD13_4531 [Escherichia coli 3-020-07_S4_C2]|nr:hypothetical protein AD13_4531 [Escherichia coli 3-020-07_S4_C2]KDZ45702.1 hypothetical protein AD41_4826 [Escherichia coli 3-020-07_S4_C3]
MLDFSIVLYNIMTNFSILTGIYPYMKSIMWFSTGNSSCC